VDLHGDLFDGVANYALGIFNGATDYNGNTSNTSFEDHKAFVARIFFQPWKNSSANELRGLGFGVGGSFQDNNPNTNSSTGLTPGYTTDGQQRFFTYNSGVYAGGTAWRLAPQAYYYRGPLSFLGEYDVSAQRVASASKSANLQNSAWEIAGGWVLTGEDASYTGITPRHPFDPCIGQWGAFQLVARFAELNVDDLAFTDGFASRAKSASGVSAWAIGLNWYLNKNIRANLSFSRTLFESFGGNASPGTVPAQPENVLFSRIQLAF
jgi:phosphate-selective porin OprO/OprP